MTEQKEDDGSPKFGRLPQPVSEADSSAAAAKAIVRPVTGRFVQSSFLRKREISAQAITATSARMMRVLMSLPSESDAAGGAAPE